MSTVQEAASLFGSGPDEGSDPFGYVVNTSSNSAQDSSPFSPPPSTSSTKTTYDSNSSSVQGKVAISNAHDYKAADDLFGGAPSDGADDLFGAGGVSDSNWFGTGDVNADASGTQGGGYTGYSNYANAGSLGAATQSQGWSGYGQGQQQQHYQAYGTSEYFPHLTVQISLITVFSIPEFLRSAKPIRGSKLASATWYALSIIYMRILALMEH